MADRIRKRRWYHPSLDRLIIALLAIQVLLLMSERYHWFTLNENRFWALLIACGVAGVAVLVMLFCSITSFVFRWSPRFGVRSLLLSVLVVSVPLGWIAWEMERATRQREAIAALKRLGARVGTDYPDDVVWRWMAHRKPATQIWLVERLGNDFFFPVVTVECFITPFGDEEAILLRSLPMLEELYLSDTQISDKSVKHLAGLNRLKLLVVMDTQVTDEGARRLQRALPNCQVDH
jgi:hypothetical protein